MECSGVLPTTQFAHRKGLGNCDALLCMSHTLQSAWRVGRRLGSCRLTSVQPLIGLTIWAFFISSALWALDVLSILTQFLINQSQQVMVDGCRSKLVNVVSGVSLAVFWAHYSSSCTRRSFFFILENKLIGYADPQSPPLTISSPVTPIDYWRNCTEGV